MQSLWQRLSAILKSDHIWRALVIFGIALRLRQYIANRSLWHDEANLALNLVNRTFGGLAQPLDYDQGAPIGWLMITKFLMFLMGNHDYILRIIPILSGLFATYLAYRLAREYFGAGGYLALLIFATSWSLVYYSSDLKQYSSDVMAVVLLIYLAFRCLGENTQLKDIILLAITGFIMIWISHPVAFVAAGIGLVLAFEKLILKSYTRLFWMLGLGITWIVSFETTYLASLRYLASDQSLKHYWRNGFMPLPPWENWGWFVKTYLSLLANSASGFDHKYLALLCSILIIIGFVSLFLRNGYMALIIIAPVFMASLASAMQIYPIRGRLSLFLVPLVILLLAEGFGRIYSTINRWSRSTAIIASLLIALSIIWMPASRALGTFLLPTMGDDIKPVMEYVSKHRAQDDIVYVYHGARPSFNYYAPFYGLDTGNIITGLDLNDSQALTQFYKHVDNKLNGNSRVWVIISHVVDCGGCEGDMTSFYIQHLNRYGSIEEQFNAQGAAVYLYNFSDP